METPSPCQNIIAFNNTQLKAGDGNDDLYIAAEGMSGGTDIFLGGGADTLVLSGGEANGGVMTGGSIWVGLVLTKSPSRDRLISPQPRSSAAAVLT